MTDRPDQAQVGDIIYIPTGGLAVSGHHQGSVHQEDHRLRLLWPDRHPADARDAGYGLSPPQTGQGPIFHSDRGVQYSTKTYRERLETHTKYVPPGDPYDNAVAENFFSCLKCELIHLMHYPTRAKAQADVFAYLETFYNSVRPHSALGWLSPNRFEANLISSAT